MRRGAAIRPDSLRQRVLALFNEDDGATRKVVDVVRYFGQEHSRAVVQTTTARLVEVGLLVREGRGVYRRPLV